MANISKNSHQFLTVWFCLAVLSGAAFNLNAQTDRTSDPRAFVLNLYNDYQQRDERALLSLCSQSSPYFADFKELVRQRFSQEAGVRFEDKRLLFIKLEAGSEKATVRVVVNFDARDIETGKEAEGFPEWDQTLYLSRESGNWKLWKFVDTAEEFSENYLAAKTDDERAELLAKAAPSTVGFRQGLLSEGRALLEEKGDDTSATVILNLVLKLTEQLKDTEGAASARVALGDVSFARGDYARAANLYQSVLKLSEDMGIKGGIAAMLAKMGNIHHAQSNNALALEYYQKSIRIYTELGSKIEIAYPLANVGDGYFALHNYEKALENYAKSLSIYQLVFDQAGSAWLLNKIGGLYAAQQKEQLAIEYYEKSRKLSEALGNRIMTAESLNNISAVRYRQGRYAEAAAISVQSSQLARESHSPEVLWRALTTTGEAYRALKRNDEASQSFQGAISVIEKLRDQVVGNERDQQRFFENKTAPYNAMVELLIATNHPVEAFSYAERAKGRMLLDVLHNGRVSIDKSMSVEEREHENKLRTELTGLNLRLRRQGLLPAAEKSEAGNLAAQIQKARLDYDTFETRIYAAHPDLKLGRAQTTAASVTEVGTLIADSRTALLEYVVTRSRTYLFVLSKDSDNKANLKVYSIDITAPDLSQRVATFRQRLADNSADFKELAINLYNLLVQPAQAQLDDRTSVCIVPSEGLWELPFQALLSKSGKYFLEEHAVSYVPSLSILLELKKMALAKRVQTPEESKSGLLQTKVGLNSPPAMPRLLAMGNPSLSSDLALPQAEEEVRKLGEIYGERESTILVGASAREETFKAAASRYPVLHFATHGVLDNANPLYSRLLLATASSDEDGFLEAREIMKLDLHADLAVLSACQTARGQVGAGEGLVGMSWALLIAGTSTTVTSQWNVESGSTSRLMVDFHRNLQMEKKSSRSGAPEALRNAALELMAHPKYRHPFFWAGFVVVGNGI